MSKVKILSVISAVLLLVNIFLLWQLFEYGHPNNKLQGPKHQIIKMLQLDATQVIQYEVMINEHRKGMDRYHETIKSLKKELYSCLQTTNIVGNADSIINEIAKVNSQIEQLNIKHFKDIKSICKPEQLPLYNEFCNHIAELFEHRKGAPNGKK